MKREVDSLERVLVVPVCSCAVQDELNLVCQSVPSFFGCYG
jgi:hypothetical protein